jgi:adenosine deaminase
MADEPNLSDDDLKALAKADLHVHLVGSAAPHTVAELAARHLDGGVPAREDELKAFYRFRDFTHFLDVYTLVGRLVRTPEDVETLAAGLAGDMRAQGTAHAEVTVTPVAHRRAGIPPAVLARALDAGAESVGPEQVWAAVENLGADRIGHGIAAAGDPRLMARRRADRITLEICPSSNVATGVVPALDRHPLPALLGAGVPVVPGSDDPPMFGTTLLEEYRRARHHLGLSGAQLRALARASIEASFAPPAVKRRLLAPA